MNADPGFVAFTGLEFQSVCGLEQVWQDLPSDYLTLQPRALVRFNEALERARTEHPLGLCFVGPTGVGKTHLLREFRHEAALHRANFVVSDLTDIREFWAQLAMHYLQAMRKRMDGVSQFQRILEVLLKRANRTSDVPALVSESRTLTREELVNFVNELVPVLRPVYRDALISRLRTFRSLLYLDADDFDLSERAYSFLQGIEQVDEESKKIYLAGPNSARRVVADLSWFLGLCGPTVLAFDQLDPFVAQNNLTEVESTEHERLKEALHILLSFVDGILAVRREFSRTLIVLTCLESTWKVLQNRPLDALQARFQEPERLLGIRDPKKSLELIARRMDVSYKRNGFTPPHRTWPFAPDFFNSIPPDSTPREILDRCSQHLLDCALTGHVRELNACAESKATPTAEVCSGPEMTSLERRFLGQLVSVDADSLLNEGNEDKLGVLLAEAAHLLRCEIPENPSIDLTIETDFREGNQHRSLHLRMRRTFHAEKDREEHICVRVLQKSHHQSFQVRFSAALTTSGISEKLNGRRLVFIRNGPVPAGKVTAEAVKRARELGAEFIEIERDDLRKVLATVELSRQKDPLFEAWLLKHTPLSKTIIFQTLARGWMRQHVAVVTKPKREFGKDILLGNRLEADAIGDPVYIAPVDLIRHVIVRAGPDSGKTVFVKRLVEEAALCGIPSIVIDTAKDFSLLGERWKERPKGWANSDVPLAEDYHKNVDVQIWTPGHCGGRPLRLTPLANLSGPFEEAHERQQAITIAVNGTLPLALSKTNPIVEKTILTNVVEWLAKQPQHSGDELQRLTDALRDLPAEALQGYQNERRLAATMADQIQTTLAADPLYGAEGEDLDPAVLFGVGAKRTRVSVLSLFAINNFHIQARFIGQLASILFNWIRRNPAPSLGIRGLLVLDEAARFLPQNDVESKPALMLLAAYARKYGLGLIWATQNQTDLDDSVVASFATQFSGASQAKVGQFFCVTPSLDRAVKLQGRMCLSAHPTNVLPQDEEILIKARASAR